MPTPESPATARRLRRRIGADRRFGFAVTTAAMAACLVLNACSQTRDGDSLARDIAADEAKALDEDLGYRNRVRDAEYIAATEVPKTAEGSGSTVRRQALSWSGRTAGNEQAIIDVQFVVTVDEQYPVSIGGQSNSAGRATRCYRYLLELARYASHQEIECPSATPAVPSAAPLPSLPADARERLTAALRSATSATLADAVRAAFPERHVTVDTITHEGRLVAAVGVPVERDCLLLVRAPGGAIESPGYEAVWLEPGEMGCTVGLYVSPPR